MEIDFSKTTNAQARKTALVVAAVLLLIALWSAYRERWTAVLILGTICLFLVFIGFFVPTLAKLFHRIWMTFALALGWVNSRILLTIIFFFVFVPYGVISRLRGRDLLRRREAKRESYWVKREKTRQAKEGFERLF